MSHVIRRLPEQPHIDIPRREARALLEEWKAGSPEALARIQAALPQRTAQPRTPKLADAQWAIAREYSFATWAELKRRIDHNHAALALQDAIRAGDAARTVDLLRRYPALRDIPLRSANWGAPLSYAANVGRLNVVQAVDALGAKDHQHALDRALLQGHLDCAEWLLGRGAKLTPGLVMGPCETLNSRGLQFLADHGAPFADGNGDRNAPFAMLLNTYSRNPEAKHACVEIMLRQGYALPDTPLSALHRGRIDLLETHLRQDPALLQRRFRCGKDLACGTALEGATLLHYAVDFDEQAIFDWLLAHGADVDAAAEVDAAGFGGHTPLFNSIVSMAYQCGRQRGAAMTRALLRRGAKRDARARLRKFLDWIETPRWHEANGVTAREWGEGFPERTWVNADALALL